MSTCKNKTQHNSDFLYLANFFPPKLLTTVQQDGKGKLQLSNHNFEQFIVAGLLKQEGLNLRILNIPRVYSYPHNNRSFYTHSEKYTIGNVPVKSIGFTNLLIANKLAILVITFFNLIAELRKFKNKRVTILHNFPTWYIDCALMLVKLCSSKVLDTTLIITDLPAYISPLEDKNNWKTKISDIFDHFTLYLAKKYNHFVFITEAMKHFFMKPNLDYIVMEGIVDEANIQDDAQIANTEASEILLYTGTLRKIFGVMDLMEMFEAGNFSNMELWICGSGEMAGEIEKRATQNSNIKFYGFVDSWVARKLQSRATILVNPRSASGEYTKYSFPSKTLEYLSAGKTVLMNHLPGIPKEYDEYLFIPRNESKEAWIKEINYIVKMPKDERRQQELKGKEFVTKYKNSTYQVGRILQMIRNKLN